MKTRSKILVVDDELFFRNILKDVLQDHYDIIEGENGEEAITLAKAHKPDLIILDVAMPVKDGIEACRDLKECAETSRIPVILFTGLSRKEEIGLGLKVGADDYITKPMSLPETLARVKAHLRPKDYYHDLEKRDLILLLDLAEHIFAIRNPMTILHMIAKKMSDIIEDTRCSIVSINPNGIPYVKASSDLEAREEIMLDLGKYPEIKQALDSKQPVIINDVRSDPIMDSVREEIKGLNFNSIFVVPVIKKENVIGTLLLRMATPVSDSVSARIYKLCQSIADLSANALETAILIESTQTARERFEEMSIRDGLTNLYNHKYFYSCLEKEFSRSRRYGTPLSLIFFDIDNFKRINDVYGHQQGDAVLSVIGELSQSVARQSDICARYGGEEFTIILPSTTAEGALDMAIRLGTLIREHVFAGLHGERITVSLGTSTFQNKNIQSPDQLVTLADKAMYQAKSLGKNRIFQA